MEIQKLKLPITCCPIRSIGNTCVLDFVVIFQSISAGCKRRSGRGWQTSSCPNRYVDNTCIWGFDVGWVFLQAGVDGCRTQNMTSVHRRMTTSPSPTSTCLQVGETYLSSMSLLISTFDEEADDVGICSHRVEVEYSDRWASTDESFQALTAKVSQVRLVEHNLPRQLLGGDSRRRFSRKQFSRRQTSFSRGQSWGQWSRVLHEDM